jgi:NAD-dependent SIR2 family protein deacetylase
VVHLETRNFSCSMCNKHFKTKYAVKEHQFVHNTEKLIIECPKCKKTFTRKCNFTKHLKFICKWIKNFFAFEVLKMFVLFIQFKITHLFSWYCVYYLN